MWILDQPPKDGQQAVDRTGIHESGQGKEWVPLEKAGKGKEIADEVRQGKAFVKIVGTPWGVEFLVRELRAKSLGLARTPGNGTNPSFRAPYSIKKAETNISGYPQPENYHSTNSLLPRIEIQTRDSLTSVFSYLGRGRAPFFVLTIFSMLSNLMAFAVSSQLSSGYIELNPSVHPGSFFSLWTTEGAILVNSVILLFIIHDVEVQTALQSLVAGVFGADALNDVILLSTGDRFLAMAMAWSIAASIPTFVCINLLRRARKHALR